MTVFIRLRTFTRPSPIPSFPNRKFMKQTAAPRSSWSRGYVRKPPTAFRLCPLLLAQAAKAHGVPAPASALIEGLVSPTGKPYVTHDMVSLVWETPEINEGVHDKLPPLCFLQVASWALIVDRQKDDKVSTDTLLVIWDTLRSSSNHLRIKLRQFQFWEFRVFSFCTYKTHVYFWAWVFIISGFDYNISVLSACRVRLLLELCSTWKLHTCTLHSEMSAIFHQGHIY